MRQRSDDHITILLFTSTGCPAGRVCPNGETSYAARFGCIDVRDWKEELLVPRKDGHRPRKGWAIVTAISCGECKTYYGGTFGGPPQPGGINAVRLIQ